MRVLGYDPVRPPDDQTYELVDWDDLLVNSDVISLHLPATAESRHLINQRSLSQMRKGVWLINTSRGALVDEPALVVALNEGQVGAAAIDVFEEEPVSVENPLLAFDNVILGAHNGSNTAEAVARTTAFAVSNLIQGLGLEEA
jgi:D-3-phosphoglycerate dehydrogenase